MPVQRIFSGKGLTARQLALVEPFCIGHHGITRGNVQKGDKVLIVGAGPIGMFAMLSAKAIGAEVYMTDLLDGYPAVTSSLLHRVEAAGDAAITIQFTSYNAATGELQFNANSSQVIDIPTYIRSLQSCGVFSTVSYTGYNADNDGYSIDLRCVLAAPQ